MTTIPIVAKWGRTTPIAMSLEKCYKHGTAAAAIELHQTWQYGTAHLTATKSGAGGVLMPWRGTGNAAARRGVHPASVLVES